MASPGIDLVLQVDDLNRIVSALRIAAEVYEKDAQIISKSSLSDPARTRLVEQFKRQAQEALDLSDQLDPA